MSNITPLNDEKFFGNILNFVVSNQQHLTGAAKQYVDANESALQAMADKATDPNLDSGLATKIHTILNGSGSSLQGGIQEIVQAHKDGKTIANADQLQNVPGKLNIGDDPSAVANWWSISTVKAPAAAAAPAAAVPATIGEMGAKFLGDPALAQGFAGVKEGLSSFINPLKGIFDVIGQGFGKLSPTTKAAGLSVVGAFLAVGVISSVLSKIPVLNKIGGFLQPIVMLGAIAVGLMAIMNVLGKGPGLQIADNGASTGNDYTPANQTPAVESGTEGPIITLG